MSLSLIEQRITTLEKANTVLDVKNALLQFLTDIINYSETLNVSEDASKFNTLISSSHGLITNKLSEPALTFSTSDFDHFMPYRPILHFIYSLNDTNIFDEVFLKRTPDFETRLQKGALSDAEVVLACLCFPICNHPQENSLLIMQEKYPSIVFYTILYTISLGFTPLLMPLNYSDVYLKAFAAFKGIGLAPDNTHINQLLTQTWFLSTYATSPQKDSIKEKIFSFIDETKNGTHYKKPRPNKQRLLVVLEFNPYTTVMYDPWVGFIRTAEKYFDICLLCAVPIDSAHYGDEIKEVFVYGSKPLEESLRYISAASPGVIFYFSLGLTHEALWFASMRLAPVQAYTLGEATSSFCKEMDYTITEASLIGDPNTFTEKLVSLPDNFSPRLSQTLVAKQNFKWKKSFNPDKTHLDIAITATALKYSISFLEMLQKIADYCKSKSIAVKLHFLTGATGSKFSFLLATIQHYIPDAIVYSRVDRIPYADILRQCDLKLGSFPYTGGNSAVDGIVLGVPSICLTGPYCYARSEAAMLSKFTHAEKQIATSLEDYFNKAVELIENESLRQEISLDLEKEASVCAYFGADGLQNMRDDAVAEALYLLSNYPEEFTEKQTDFGQVWNKYAPQISAQESK